VTDGLRVEYLDLEGLARAPRNPKHHDLGVLQASLDRFGFVAPILVDDATGRLVAGHGRVDALQQLKAAGAPAPERVRVHEGRWLVPVIRGVAFASPLEAESYLVADNQTTILGGWDSERLADVLADLAAQQALGGTGFDQAAVDALLRDVGRSSADEEAAAEEERLDRAAELQVKWETDREQLWQIGPHRLLCGDAMSEADIGRLMSERAALVYTDPPYGMDLDTDFSEMVGLARGNVYARVTGDDRPYDPAHLFAHFGYCREVILWGADYYAERIPERLNGSWFVWDKAAGGEAPNEDYDKMFGSNFELAWSRTRHKRALVRVLWKGIFGLANESKRRLHPAQKPAELARFFLSRFAVPGAVVVDTFAGSGSTFVAAEQLGRRCFGMEIEPKYVAVILERMHEMGLVPRRRG
jgi:DNA modification methylase